MKHLLKSISYLILFVNFSYSYGQVMNTTAYRDISLPRIEIDPSHYGFIYPVEKDFYDSISYTPPIDGRFFVQNYGPRTLGNYDNHQGSDIWGHTIKNGLLTYNPPALCMCDGEIVSIIDGPDTIINLTISGRTIRYRCDSSSQVFNSPINIYYRHLDSINNLLLVGMNVSKGDTLGFVGKSGTTTLTHLHFDYKGIPNQWGNTTSTKYLNPNRLFDPNEHPRVSGKLDNAHIEILHDWADSTLIRVHWPHNQHINRFEFTNGNYNLIYDVEEVRASYAVFEPSIWARDSMLIFPYRTNGYRTAFYYQQNFNYPAIFPNSPHRDTNLVMYGFSHIPTMADSVVNVYDFILKYVPSGHNIHDWAVKLSDVWGYSVEGNFTTYGTANITACDSYTWIDGATYTSSNNTAIDTLINTMGGDSIVTLNLTIINSTSATDIQTACDSYLWIDGNTYTSSNNLATHTLTNAVGCDSVITLNLTINTVNSSVIQVGELLTANEPGAIYQWLDCSGMTAISGATSQAYTAIANGNYSVIVTKNGCSDTSICYTVTSVGIIENNFGDRLLIYPNPTNGDFSIDLGQNYQTITITITDASGKVIQYNTYSKSQFLKLKIEEPSGVYLLGIKSLNNDALIRLIKE